MTDEQGPELNPEPDGDDEIWLLTRERDELKTRVAEFEIELREAQERDNTTAIENGHLTYRAVGLEQQVAIKDEVIRQLRECMENHGLEVRIIE